MAAEPGSAEGLHLVVSDIEEARDDLVARGVDVSEVFHCASGYACRYPGNDARVPGPHPDHATYGSFLTFDDPDGNGWLLQEITSRLPGREWVSPRARATDAATLAALLRETSERHDRYEKTHGEHYWWDWYAPYMSARQQGSSPDEASAAADRYVDEVLHVPPR